MSADASELIQRPAVAVDLIVARDLASALFSFGGVPGEFLDGSRFEI